MNVKTATTRTSFYGIPAEEGCLFDVREGIDASFALSHAEILSNFVQSVLFDAVSDDNALAGDAAYLCEFLMDTAKALRTAAGATA